MHTLTSCRSDFSKGVITSVTLTADNSSFAWALPSDGVTGSRIRAKRETLAGVAGVVTLWTIVVFLQKTWIIKLGGSY